MEAWLEGLPLPLALAGPAGDLKMICSVAVSDVMLPTVPALHRKKIKTGVERSGPTPSAFRRASWPGGNGTGGVSSAAAERLRCWIAWTAPGHMERGTCSAFPIIFLGSCSDGGLAGRTAAAAGSCWACWRSQECSAPSPSRVLCSRLCLIFTP